MKKFLQKNKWGLLGIVIGALGGFFYWKYVGCASGTCMITSRPLNSAAYGGLMGYLLFSLIKTTKAEIKPVKPRDHEDVL